MKFGRKVLRFPNLMISGFHGVIFPMENFVLKFLQPAAIK